MSKLLPRINSLFEKIPDFAAKNRIKLLFLFVCLTAFGAVGAGRVQVDNSVNSFFSKDDTVRQVYDRFRAIFGSDEVLYIVYRAKDDDIFSEKSLAAVKGIQENLLQQGKGTFPEFKHITDVDTIVNVSFLEGKEGTLISREFVGDMIPRNKKSSTRLKKAALAHPDYPLLLVSNDGKYGGIIVRTDFNSRRVGKKPPLTASLDPEFTFDETLSNETDYLAPEFEIDTMKDYVPFIAAVKSITDKSVYSEHLKFYYAGNPELMGFLGRIILKEMEMIMLGSILLIMGVLAVLFRSVGAVLWPTVVVASTVVWLLGTIGWSGIPTADIVNIIIFLLIAVGVADSIHIISGYVFFRRNGRKHAAAISAVYKKTGFACFLTSLTTSVGFLCMAVVPIVSMQRFGVFAALGVLYAFLITMFILPLMLDILSPLSRKKDIDPSTRPLIQAMLAHLQVISFRFPIAVSLIAALLGIFLSTGFFRTVVDSNLLTIIKEDRPIRHAYDVVDQTMAGTGNMEILIDTGKQDGFKNPALLKAMDHLQQELESKYGQIVKKTTSLVNVTKDAYCTLNDGRKDMYAIPSNPEVLAQTLFLFNSANPEDRRLFVSDDYRISRITINTRNIGSLEGTAFMAKVLRSTDRYFKTLRADLPELKISFTGQIPLFLKMMDYMSWSQIKSFGVVLVMISLILLLVFGSMRIGLIAVLPNLLPIVTVFGIMGYFNIPLDLHTLLVLPIIIGITVDDTIHFLTHFRLEYKKTGDTRQAITNAMQEVGQAIVFTSLVLAVGYLIFLLAVNKGFGYFGALSSVSIIMATLADLVLLPALLIIGWQAPKTKRSLVCINQ